MLLPERREDKLDRAGDEDQLCAALDVPAGRERLPDDLVVDEEGVRRAGRSTVVPAPAKASALHEPLRGWAPQSDEVRDNDLGGGFLVAATAGNHRRYRDDQDRQDNRFTSHPLQIISAHDARGRSSSG